MLVSIIRTHNEYINDTTKQKASGTYLTMMTKIRAAQSLGSAMCGRNNHTRGYEIYKKTINEILSPTVSQHFSEEHINILQRALNLSENLTDNNSQEKAWFLRGAIDTVYDSCLNELNDVESQRPNAFQSQIKDVINEASPYVTAGNYHEGLSKYITLLNRLQKNTQFKSSISEKSLEMVAKALLAARNCDDLEASVKTAREILDQLYNEIRLPDLYGPSVVPQQAVENKTGKNVINALLMTDFRQRDGSLFEYNLQAVDDKVMGGKSQSNIELDEENQYLKFTGTLTKLNRGGFASFRIKPTVKDELKKILTDMKGLKLEVKLLCDKNKRFKVQLANEAHLKSFNWQSEFVLEAGSEFQSIYLETCSFWPTMFGHVLSSPGNVDFNKVDCMGIIVSHVTVDGKENPDFHEGDFGLAIRSISLVK